MTVFDIIDNLLQIHQLSGQPRSQVFNSWLSLVDTILPVLPGYIKPVLWDGLKVEDVPQVNRLKHSFEQVVTGPLLDQVWGLYLRSFDLLLDKASEGLWRSYSETEGCLMGADILFDVGLAFLHPPAIRLSLPSWSSLMRQAAPDAVWGATNLILDALERACQHPDNSWGHEVLAGRPLRQGLETGEATAWLLQHIIPAALPFYTPVVSVTLTNTSSTRVLANAYNLPRWAVLLGLIQFLTYGLSPSPCPIEIFRINDQIYGLSGQFRLLRDAAGPLEGAPPATTALAAYYLAAIHQLQSLDIPLPPPFSYQKSGPKGVHE